MLWYSLQNCPALLVWPTSPLHPIPCIAFLGWHPLFGFQNIKQKVPVAPCFSPSGSCHAEHAQYAMFQHNPISELESKPSLFHTAHRPNSQLFCFSCQSYSPSPSFLLTFLCQCVYACTCMCVCVCVCVCVCALGNKWMYNLDVNKCLCFCIF